VFSCTSNGALRLKPINSSEGNPVLASLPTRLSAWRLSSDNLTFAYGGDEVDLSLWDSERAFSNHSAPELQETANQKRKRDALFPGEIWRAKNIPNDFLGLRQPIRITCLTYLSNFSPQQPESRHHIVTGTQLGDLRRYDTRAARRPVSNWKGIGKVGGVKVVEQGLVPHEIFVGDCGSNLYSLDLRNGSIVYGYKGLSGSVTSLAPSPSILVSTSLDRYARIHSTFPPPSTAGDQQPQKGAVLDKVFMKSIPTVVVWDGDDSHSEIIAANDDEADNDVWDEMENVEDDGDDEPNAKKKRRDDY